MVAVPKRPQKSVVVRILQGIWCGYTYLYYRIYAWNLRMWGESDLPQWNAMLGVAVLSGINIMTLIILIRWFFGVDIFHQNEHKVLYWVCALAWFFINYLLLIRGGKYKRIAAYLSSRKGINKRLGTLFCWTYAVLTFVLIFVVAGIAKFA